MGDVAFGIELLLVGVLFYLLVRVNAPKLGLSRELKVNK